MSDATSTTPAPITADATGVNPDQNGGTGAAPAAGTAPAIAFATDAEFQAKVDEMLRERLKRADDKAAAAAQKALDKAAQESAAKSGEWEQLATSRAAKLAEAEAQAADLTARLEAQTVQAERLDKALRAQLEGLRKNVAKPVLALLDKLPTAEQLEWLAANQDQANPVRPNGVPATPKPAGQMDAALTEEGRRAVAAMYREF